MRVAHGTSSTEDATIGIGYIGAHYAVAVVGDELEVGTGHLKLVLGKRALAIGLGIATRYGPCVNELLYEFVKSHIHGCALGLDGGESQTGHQGDKKGSERLFHCMFLHCFI